MAEFQKIGKKDIKKFIVVYKYGEHGYRWPQGIGGTVVLSTVKIHYTRSSSNHSVPQQCTITTQSVYENERHPNHAERRFLDDLTEEIDRLTAAESKVHKVEAKLVQNYSPCNSCADRILQFQTDDMDFFLTIKFANFYKHREQANETGLKSLLQNNITLVLLQGEVEWKEFLNDEAFVDLTDQERKEMLVKAFSDERKERESLDREILCRLQRDEPQRDDPQRDEPQRDDRQDDNTQDDDTQDDDTQDDSQEDDSQEDDSQGNDSQDNKKVNKKDKKMGQINILTF